MGPKRCCISNLRLKMTIIVPSTKVSHPITIRWSGDNGKEYWSDYWATLQQDGRLEEGLPIMEIDIAPYIQYINWDLFERDEDDKASSVELVNVGFSRKRKRANDDEDGLVTKRIPRGCSPAVDEDLKNLQYLDEGPSRWGSCGKEVEVIDFTAFTLETYEDEG